MVMISCRARPASFEFDSAGTVLLMIDFQNDFLLPGGFGESLGNNVSLLQAALGPARTVLWAFRTMCLPVIHTREGHKPDLSDCPRSKLMQGTQGRRIGDMGSMGRILIIGEPGQGIISDLLPVGDEPVVDKPGKGAFYSTRLNEMLQELNAKCLIVAGVTTEVCVQSTVREASDRGYRVLVLEDCVASYNPALHSAALEMVCSQGGIFGSVASSEDFISALNGSQ